MPGQKSWSDARAACQAAGLQFASVTSKAENELLVKAADTNVWIGGTDDVKEGTWKWISSGTTLWISPGTTLGYANWNSEEPNNMGDNEHCIEVKLTGYWNDADCRGQLPYVCEERRA